MAGNMQIKMSIPEGVTLKTAGKFCGTDIVVTPELEEVIITENGEYTPSSVGYSKVNVNVENSGGSGFYTVEETETGGAHYIFDAEESGAVKLNIAYGNTEPRDTSKLWVKTEEPSGIIVSADIETTQKEEITTLTATMPIGCYGVGTVVVGKTVYLLGGQMSGSGRSNVIRCFDTETETVTTLSATLPVVMSYLCPILVGTNAYLFFKGHVYKFDTKTQITTTLSVTLAASDPIGAGGVALVGTQIYLFMQNRGSKAVLQRFNTITETITTISLSQSRGMENVFVFPHGNYIYVCCGNDVQNNVFTYYDTIDRFNTLTDSIETIDAKFPACMQYLGLVTVGSKTYILGGRDSVGVYYDTIYCFDAENETLYKSDTVLPKVTSYAYGALVDGCIYIFGGYDGTNHSKSIVKYIPPTDEYFVDEDTVQIIPSLTANQFALVNTPIGKVEIGVDKVFKGDSSRHAEPVEAYLYKDGTWTSI